RSAESECEDMAAGRQRHVSPGRALVIGAEHAAILGRAVEMLGMARVRGDGEHRALERTWQCDRLEARAIVVAHEEGALVAVEIIARTDIEFFRLARREGERPAVRALVAQRWNGKLLPMLPLVITAEASNSGRDCHLTRMSRTHNDGVKIDRILDHIDAVD